MNRNHMLKRKMTAGLAVGMAVAVGSVPMAMAANTANTKDSSSSVSKEETVYVNADASGNPQQITVSNWLKNAGSESSVEDQSDLTNIKNVKGDETFSENGDSLTWNTDGSDIYYQGQSNKDLPVSVKFTYLLDGQEMQPQDLVGKSGHLQIKIQYTNNEKKSAKVDGKNETIYSPFVMLTAMILPDDTFSNVTIDNGKVISDGSRNIVVGVGMPGLKDSLKLDTIDLSADDDDKNSEDKTLDIDIPDSVSIEADVTDFSMSSSLTVALSDLLKDIDFDDDSALDDIKDALDNLTDAATQLVDGTSDLYDGVEELDEKYGEFDDGVKELRDGTHDLSDGVGDLTDGVNKLADGAKQLQSGAGDLASGAKTLDDGAGKLQSGSKDLVSGVSQLASGATVLQSGAGQLQSGAGQLQSGAAQLQSGAGTLQSGINDYTAGVDLLNAGIQANLSSDSELNTKVSQFAQGINTLAAGVNSYTAGTDSLADGVTAYVEGEKQLSQGAQALTQIQGALSTLTAALDGEGETTEDLVAASNALAQGTASLKASLGTDETKQLMTLLDSMLTTGNELIKQASDLPAAMQTQIVDPVNTMIEQATGLKDQLNAQLGAIQQYVAGLQSVVNNINAQVKAANDQVDAANGQIKTANDQIATANGQIASAKQSLLTQAAAARQNGDEALATALETAANQIPEVSSVTASVPYVKASVGDVTPLNTETLQALMNGLAALPTQIQTIVDNANGLLGTVGTMKEKIDSITTMKDQIPAADITALSTGVDLLDSNMQDFNAAMGNLSTQVATLNTQASAGIKQLLDGFAQLDANNETLTGGAAQLKANSASLTSGAAALQTGAGQLIEGLNQLSTQMTEGAGQLAANSQTLRDGAATLKGGIDSAKNGIDTLKSGTDTLKGGTDTLKTGADTLKSGAGTLQSGINTLKSGTSALSSGADTLKSGTNDLRKGTLDLKSGAQTLADGVSDLKDGADTLSDASDDVVDGISELKDGAEDLKDGMQEFYDEGISKIKDMADENLTVILDRLKALTSDEISYDTYSGRSDNMNGSVKFIIETDEIE